MIRRVALSAAVLLLVFGLAASASLKEVQTSADLAVDPGTGNPAVYFSAVLEYDPRPDEANLTISWSLYVLEGGREETVSSTSRTSHQDPAPGKLYLMSAALPVEPGKTYGAHLVLQDSANGLSYRKDFRYVAPLVVPLGIRLEGWDGSSAVDLTGVADEELEDLVTIYNHVKTYVQTASDVALNLFLSSSMAAVQTFPAVVMVIPNAGLSTTFGETKGVTLTVGQSFVLYVLPSANELAALRTQVAEFERSIEGDVYLGSGDLGAVTAVCAYVDEIAWSVLQAASTEWAKRTK
jgi:hypothetical protein